MFEQCDDCPAIRGGELVFDPQCEVVRVLPIQAEALSPLLGNTQVQTRGLGRQLEKAAEVELVNRRLHGLSREAETPRELRDVHLSVGLDGLKGSVLRERQAERLQRLIDEDFDAMLDAAKSDDDLPTGREPVRITHVRFIA